jgi:hypothetical protein
MRISMDGIFPSDDERYENEHKDGLPPRWCGCQECLNHDETFGGVTCRRATCTCVDFEQAMACVMEEVAKDEHIGPLPKQDDNNDEEEMRI